MDVECKYKCRVINSVYTESVERHIADICQKIKNHSSGAFASAMRDYLNEYDNMLIFADEDFKGMSTKEFALFCKFTDSFFVLICRNSLSKLPYSYTEIYTKRQVENSMNSFLCLIKIRQLLKSAALFLVCPAWAN